MLKVIELNNYVLKNVFLKFCERLFRIVSN